MYSLVVALFVAFILFFIVFFCLTELRVTDFRQIEMCVCACAFSCFRNLCRERVKITGLGLPFLESPAFQVGLLAGIWEFVFGSASADGHCRGPGREGHLQGDENENLVQINFVNLDQIPGSLMPGASLSEYLKHSTI